MRQMSVPILEVGGGGGALSAMRVMILYLTMRQMSVPSLVWGGGGGFVNNEGDDSVPDDEADVSANFGGGGGGGLCQQ